VGPSRQVHGRQPGLGGRPRGERCCPLRAGAIEPRQPISSPRKTTAKMTVVMARLRTDKPKPGARPAKRTTPSAVAAPKLNARIGPSTAMSSPRPRRRRNPTVAQTARRWHAGRPQAIPLRMQSASWVVRCRPSAFPGTQAVGAAREVAVRLDDDVFEHREIDFIEILDV
jgi:hypothetical protein